MLRYRAFDRVTNSRHLVQSIDFRFGKVQLVPPGKDCYNRWKRVFPQIVFELCLNIFDKNSEEIYIGDTISYKGLKKPFNIDSQTLKVYNESMGGVGYLYDLSREDIEVVGKIIYK